MDVIRETVSAILAAGMESLRTELKSDLLEFRKCFREDIKERMDEFTSETHRKLQDMTGQIKAVVGRVGQIEKNLADTER